MPDGTSAKNNMNNDGRLGWDDGVAEIASDLKNHHTDKRLLANRLLSNSDASLVAEGMVLLVQEELPNAENILVHYHRDQRRNRWQSSNAEFARVCQLALKIKQKNTLDPEEREFLSHWQDVLHDTFGL